MHGLNAVTPGAYAGFSEGGCREGGGGGVPRSAKEANNPILLKVQSLQLSFRPAGVSLGGGGGGQGPPWPPPAYAPVHPGVSITRVIGTTTILYRFPLRMHARHSPLYPPPPPIPVPRSQIGTKCILSHRVNTGKGSIID